MPSTWARAAASGDRLASYILRRLLLLVPTLLGIIAINFAVVQFAPGGPVEQAMAEARAGGAGVDSTARITGATSDSGGYRGATRAGCKADRGAEEGRSASTSRRRSDSC